MAWGPCPDGAISHGPVDGEGRCPWCRTKITTALSAPRSYPRTDLGEAYAQHYDPDEGARGTAELERLRRAGTLDLY